MHLVLVAVGCSRYRSHRDGNLADTARSDCEFLNQPYFGQPLTLYHRFIKRRGILRTFRANNLMEKFLFRLIYFIFKEILCGKI